MRILLFLVLFYLLSACQDQAKNQLLEDTPEAELVVAKKIISPEKLALENKIAARALLQKIIDENNNFKKEKFFYECSPTTGGLLTIITKEKEIKGIRFANNQEQKSDFISLYYHKNKLSLVVYEQDKWLGDEEEMSQTIFYLDKGEVFHSLHKNIKGNSSEIEQLILKTSLKKIAINHILLQYILDQEIIFKKITQNNIAEYYCN